MKIFKYVLALIMLYLIYTNLGKVIEIGNTLIDKVYNVVVVKSTTHP